jgi:hypothetical protein
LRSAVAETRLFNNSDDITYDIEIVIKLMAVPTGFATSSVTITADYKISRTNSPVFTERIRSRGEAAKELVDGSKRIRSAYQNAVRINIELFIDELLKNSDTF